MLGFIKGILRDKDYDNITVECGGVGFNIMVTNSCMANLPGLDEEVKIWATLPSTSVNNVAQILDFNRRRRAFIDPLVEAL